MNRDKRRLPRVTELAHDLIRKFVGAGDRVVDATVGNGHDTAFLLELVGLEGRVYGFDIQEPAIESTRKRIGGSANAELFCESHENLKSSLDGRVRAVMFNLGYFPSGDKTIITRPHTTVEALSQALDILDAPGLITVIVYPGHEGGRDEASAVEKWIESLAPSEVVCSRFTTGRIEDAFPYLIAIEKRRVNRVESVT